MIWHIPTKTFLLGEYAAIGEGSALVLTTTPSFSLSLNESEAESGIHPESPAGKWLLRQSLTKEKIHWHDPYKGQGGLGASSAQFIGVFLASCHLQNKAPTLNNLLSAYYECAWNQKGLKPSGYDVIAQSQKACVFINKKKQIVQSYPWPFKDLSFILIHSGKKLATHNHLLEVSLPKDLDTLSSLSDDGRVAFEQSDTEKLVHSINCYHKKLAELGLVAQHSYELIHQLSNLKEVLAIKGCGAMGSDLIIIVCQQQDKQNLIQQLLAQGHHALATEDNLNTKSLKFSLDYGL